jgi:hypothetical protein
MQHLGYYLLGVAIVIAAGIARPRRAHCPERFWVNGIRASGDFSCLRTPDREGDRPADASVAGELYCMGTIPVVVSDRAVECRSW